MFLLLLVMMVVGNKSDETSLEEAREKPVRSLIFLHIKVEASDKIARKMSKIINVEDVFLVTGNYDVVIKAHFDNYDELKDFLTVKINQIDGVKDSKSMMLVSSYKERNKFIKANKAEKEDKYS